MGSSRIFFGLSFVSVCTFAGCGNLIGLGDYSVTGDSAGDSGAGTGNVAGGAVEGGSAGVAITGEGGSSGTSEGDSGAAGAGGSAGSAGEPSSCPAGCDDANDCTTDSCVLGACTNEALAAGAPCGVSRSCNAQALCVRCLDTAAGTAPDMGCSATAPICLGLGLDAACAGCATATDCSDGNECTTETCTANKCVYATVAAGSACATGVCNGAASAEKCVACADNAAGSTQDAGCTPGKPVCDVSGTPTCYECLTSTDCATDNVSCTVETCTNHVCSHVATDSKCALSGDVCKPNKCDAALDCKSVDISMPSVVVGTGSGQGNGGFEASSGSGTATGWANVGTFKMIYSCGPSTSGCAGSNGTTVTQSGVGGDYLAWLGGTPTASVTGIDHLIVLPVGTVRLQVIADHNFQTKSAAATNKDSFEVRLLDSAKVQVGLPLFTASNTTAQTGNGKVAWTPDGINKTIDVATYAAAHVGADSYLSFWSSVDANQPTDFFIDNVRVTATVCK